jgi:hypothetical protein
MQQYKITKKLDSTNPKFRIEKILFLFWFPIYIDKHLNINYNGKGDFTYSELIFNSFKDAQLYINELFKYQKYTSQKMINEIYIVEAYSKFEFFFKNLFTKINNKIINFLQWWTETDGRLLSAIVLFILLILGILFFFICIIFHLI